MPVVRFRSVVTLANFALKAVLAVLIGCAVASGIAHADDDKGKDLPFTSPVTGATVRESVPVRIARAALPTSGYATVTIDGNFIKATALPDDDSGTIYVWDTKAPYTLPDNPDQKLYVSDGDHVITVAIYNRDNTVYGTASAKVRVSNTIPELKDGLKLVYKWQNSQDVKFHRTSELDIVNSSSGLPPDTVQKSDVYFRRTVEDTENGTDVLIRDQVQPDGVVTTSGAPGYVQSKYQLKGRLRTVSASGVTLRNNPPLSTVGSHYGFAVPAFPPRRVQVGDSWQAPIEVALQWASEHPTVLRGTGRLDSFEWQDGYPCAKVIENYTGPARLEIDSVTGDVPAIQGANVQVTRTVWFAYTSGKLIHVSTDMKVDASLTTGQVSAIGGDPGKQAPPAPDPAGVNPFTPPTGPNSVGNFAPQPGTSINTGQAHGDVSFHVSEEIAMVSR
jgi:hypothetical protein